MIIQAFFYLLLCEKVAAVYSIGLRQLKIIYNFKYEDTLGRSQHAETNRNI